MSASIARAVSYGVLVAWSNRETSSIDRCLRAVVEVLRNLIFPAGLKTGIS